MVQGRIVIDSERCKGCGLCTSVCPQNVIRTSNAFNSKGYRPMAPILGEAIEQATRPAATSVKPQRQK